MKNLQHLSSFEVRMIDEIEVEKPELYEMFEGQTRDNAFRTLTESTCQQALDWEKATKAIKLPTIPEFIEHSRINSGCSPFEDEQKEIDTKELYLIYQFTNDQLKKPDLSQFVPVGKNGEVLEEPDAYDDYITAKSTSDNDWNPVIVDLCHTYHSEMQNVVFEGWTVTTKNPKRTTFIDGRGNTLRVSHEYDNEMSVNRVTYNTIEALNNECQLYLKVK